MTYFMKIKQWLFSYCDILLCFQKIKSMDPRFILCREG